MDLNSVLEITHRPRRLRKSESLRHLTQETWLQAEDFVQPLFVTANSGSEPIDALPGQSRHGIENTLRECEELQKVGVRAVALFPKIDPAIKDDHGTEALNPETLILKAVRKIKERFPQLLVITDIALDPYTTSGHDGLLTANGDDVDNDPTVDTLTKMAVLHAQNGVDIVAPSDMMDGRVGAIRKALDKSGYQNTSILAYTAKYHSAYYGPFREAVGSAKSSSVGHVINKKTYQMNPANVKEALTEAYLDENEGADMLMVKPAGLYLDIIHRLSQSTTLPIAAYQISGEYAQIHAAVERGWFNLEECREESLMAIKRAGASIILTYFAKEQAKALKNR